MHLGDLENQLQQKLKEQTKQIETLYTQQLEKLQQSFRSESQNALNTINRDMERMNQTIKAQTEEMIQLVNTQMRWLLIAPGVTLMSLCIGFLGISWVMGRSLTQQAQQLQTQQQTLEILKQKNWGVELHHTDNGKFLILPPDTEYQTDWKCDNKPCLKL